MKTFRCDCGNQVFFENTHCVACGRLLGYDAALGVMRALTSAAGNQLGASDGTLYRLCGNGRDYQVCNWLVAAAAPADLCLACSLNHMIPVVAEPARRAWWASMESAKRRLLFTLLRLGLPVRNRLEDPLSGLAFAFIEDRRSNPLVEEEHVATGHRGGLITVNLAEADDVQREFRRIEMGESYRTLLGHLRHESGHYYFELLLRGSARLTEFRELFGDEGRDYSEALSAYYASPPQQGWSGNFISAYAQSHPLEDWAESWAHYLHMVDTLETASQFGFASADHLYRDVYEWMPDWESLTVALNALNRSMGLRDAYPFVAGTGALRKLHFVHQVIDPR